MRTLAEAFADTIIGALILTILGFAVTLIAMAIEKIIERK
jgi:hypothetical protein